MTSLVRSLQFKLTATRNMVNSLFAWPAINPGPPLTQAHRPPAPKAPKAPPPPAQKSYTAGAALGPPSHRWTEVQKKKTAKKVLITPGYTKINRELIVKLSTPVPASISNNTILLAANTTLAPADIQLVLVGRTLRENLSLFTKPGVPAFAVEP